MSTADTWTITNTRPDPPALAQHNSVFTVSNGYLGLSGKLAEEPGGDCPLTIINGLYDELDMFSLVRPSAEPRPWLDSTRFAGAGRSPAVANLPNPLLVRVFLDGRQLCLDRGRIAGFRQQLDLRCGLYHYAFDYDDGRRAARVEMWRFAALAQGRQVYMRYRITPASGGFPLHVESGIDGRVRSNVTGEQQFAVVRLEARPPQTCRLQARTRAGREQVHLSVVNRCPAAGGLRAVRGVCEHGAVYTRYEFDALARRPITLERRVTLRCSADWRHAGLPAARGGRLSFDAALERQRAAWAGLWRRADVRIAGDERAQRYLRFALHHLLAAAPRFSDRLSVPVKLLTGEHYQGNTFYDVDLYITPFYLFTFPRLARACLGFRHAGLPAARRSARALGFAGAKFAWQAGPDGQECLGDWYHFVHTNIHINGAVAYSLMQYYWATGDENFMRRKGVEILVESARFYAARASYDRHRDAYDIHDVAGPDEAHCHSSNNFYTNYLAGQTLRWAAAALERLRARDPRSHRALCARLALGGDEPARWRAVARRLTLLCDLRSGVYQQCAGFGRLAPPPADLLERRSEWFVPLFRYQALNQPDVLLALALFRDEFPPEVRRANWEFYRRKSLDFSSMSFAAHALVAADLGAAQEAYQNFIISAGMDLDPSLTGRGDTRRGLHGSALGGAWLAAVCGLGGLHLWRRGLRINPCLPAHWRRLEFELRLRGRALRVAIDPQQVSLTCRGRRELGLPLTVAGRRVTLGAAQAGRVRYRA